MIRILLLMAAFLLPAGARADELRPAYLELSQRNDLTWSVVWKAPLIGGMASQTRPLVPPGCTLALAPPRLVTAALVARGTLVCTGPQTGRSVGLVGMPGGGSDALLRIVPLDAPARTLRLTAAAPDAIIEAVPDRWQVFATYLKLGFAHILEGYDHLLFVIALVLLLQRGWAVAKAVTAFTVAHSLTLAGVTIGLLGLAQAPVEACIALSIVFLAVEAAKAGNGTPRLSQRLPWLVAFIFGLLHGFGFAGALREIGLPQGEVPTALLAFNLGVEAGQLLVVGGAVAVIAAIRRLAPALLRPATTAATYAIGVLASFWFIDRMFA